MAEQGSSPSAKQDRPEWKNWRLLLLLFLLVLPLRLWLLFNTEVAARDSIGFIRYALQFEWKPWQEVLLKNHQHPGYPLAIWLVSQPVRAVAGMDPVTMRISAQIATTVAALALLFPMYFLGKELFNRQVGFWAALLFQYLPVSGHHLSDGISEALFLFLVAMALWRGVVAVREYRPGAFFWCGLWAGLAYLTRPEGILVVIAVSLTIAGMQMFAGKRKRWPAFLANGSALWVAAGAVGSVYVLTTGHFTNKPALIQNLAPSHAPIPQSQAQPSRHLVASVFGVFITRADSFSLRLSRGLAAMAAEFNQGFHYFGWAPALLALIWHRHRLRQEPVFWVLIIYCLLHGAILLLLAMVEFYVSDRHMMVLILCGSFFCVAGLRDSVCRLAMWHKSKRWGAKASTFTGVPAQPAASGPPWKVGLQSGANPLMVEILLFAIVLVCAPKTAQRLHGNRAGNHQAGLWLAPRLKEGDIVLDDHSYSHYYTGLVFSENKKPILAKECRPTCYVVVTRSTSDADGVRKKNEEEIRQSSTLVYRWPENKAATEARVVVYAQPRDMAKNPWTVAP